MKIRIPERELTALEQFGHIVLAWLDVKEKIPSQKSALVERYRPGECADEEE